MFGLSSAMRINEWDFGYHLAFVEISKSLRIKGRSDGIEISGRRSGEAVKISGE